jgi:hypothetical protein
MNYLYHEIPGFVSLSSMNSAILILTANIRVDMKTHKIKKVGQRGIKQTFCGGPGMGWHHVFSSISKAIFYVSFPCSLEPAPATCKKKVLGRRRNLLTIFYVSL